MVSFLAPRLLSAAGIKAQRPTTAATQTSGQDEQFQKIITGAMQTRFGFALHPANKRNPLGSPLASNTALQEAANEYRALAVGTLSSPNPARYVLILEHTLGKPLDKGFIERRLRPALQKTGRNEAQIEAEMALWTRLYADESPYSSSLSPAQAETRIRQMQLHLLENRALADLYEKAGQKERARPFTDTLYQKSLSFFVRVGVQGIVMMLAGGVGAICLIIFALGAAGQNWQTVARVATAPQKLGWGDLLDAFVLYLALIFAARVVAGLGVAAYLPDPTSQQIVLIQAAVYIGTALLATAYLWNKARKSGTTLADVGLTTRGSFWGNVGYGVLGYCATLPLTFVLGLLARFLFKNNPNTAPNPILPLMAGDRNTLDRLLIFGLASICAPLFEELFFRGVLFSGLRTRFGWVVSGLISGALFAIVHPMQDWPVIFGLGFVFATMREMRQSLVPGMVAHFLQNTAAFLMLSALFGD